MTLPANGTLSASQINTEVGRAWNTPGGAAERIFRDLAEVGDGGYSGANFYGKSVIKPLQAALSTYLSETTFYRAGRPYFNLDVTCSSRGGVPPYSYHWEEVASYGTKFTLTNADSAKVIFFNLGGNGADWRCRVTDSRGQVSYSPNLQIRFYYK
ncbi:hypothetical protein ACPRNU_10020 [Chromobacterium vaccinii]|uniref:hypothetical protein n=1 Tax=Chromobacterium vaccinii TaxID=1108595 RepID=UPI003C7814B9